MSIRWMPGLLALLLTASIPDSALASNPCNKEGRAFRDGTAVKIDARNKSDSSWSFKEGYAQSAGSADKKYEVEKPDPPETVKTSYRTFWQGDLHKRHKENVVSIFVNAGDIVVTCTATFERSSGRHMSFLSAGCDNGSDVPMSCKRDYGPGQKRFNISYSFD